MEIQALQTLENKRAWGEIDKALKTLPKKTPELLKYASAYYVRRGKAETSLAYYAEYVNSTAPGERDLEATSFAMQCADRLKRHDLVREYFFALDPRERERLETPSLTLVASALIQGGLFDEAEKILRFIRHRSGTPQLGDFSSVIQDTFGGVSQARAYAEKTKPATLSESFKVALAHMATGNYKNAEKVLIGFKAQLAA